MSMPRNYRQAQYNQAYLAQYVVQAAPYPGIALFSFWRVVVVIMKIIVGLYGA